MSESNDTAVLGKQIKADYSKKWACIRHFLTDSDFFSVYMVGIYKQAVKTVRRMGERFR